MQSIPLAVLKLVCWDRSPVLVKLHAIHTACGIETNPYPQKKTPIPNCMQSIPLAVWKHHIVMRISFGSAYMPCIRLAGLTGTFEYFRRLKIRDPVARFSLPFTLRF